MVNSIAVIILKFKQCDFTIHLCVQKIQMEWQKVQTLIRLLRQFDLGLRCLPKLKCSNS